MSIFRRRTNAFAEREKGFPYAEFEKAIAALNAQSIDQLRKGDRAGHDATCQEIREITDEYHALGREA